MHTNTTTDAGPRGDELEEFTSDLTTHNLDVAERHVYFAVGVLCAQPEGHSVTRSGPWARLPHAYLEPGLEFSDWAMHYSEYFK